MGWPHTRRLTAQLVGPTQPTIVFSFQDGSESSWVAELRLCGFDLNTHKIQGFKNTWQFFATFLGWSKDYFESPVNARVPWVLVRGFFPRIDIWGVEVETRWNFKTKRRNSCRVRTFLSDLEIRLFFSCLEHLFFATPTKIHFEVEQQRNRDLSWLALDFCVVFSLSLGASTDAPFWDHGCLKEAKVLWYTRGSKSLVWILKPTGPTGVFVVAVRCWRHFWIGWILWYFCFFGGRFSTKKERVADWFLQRLVLLDFLMGLIPRSHWQKKPDWSQRRRWRSCWRVEMNQKM